MRPAVGAKQGFEGEARRPGQGMVLDEKSIVDAVEGRRLTPGRIRQAGAALRLDGVSADLVQPVEGPEIGRRAERRATRRGGARRRGQGQTAHQRQTTGRQEGRAHFGTPMTPVAILFALPDRKGVDAILTAASARSRSIRL
ncbi:hypothetical protein D3C73_1342950 [compost metagenome]